ncbi:MAG: DMP19 family protein [Bacteroidetes bacterium]|nr:DMP19 family protein [Bacteroidota bacterium]
MIRPISICLLVSCVLVLLHSCDRGKEPENSKEIPPSITEDIPEEEPILLTSEIIDTTNDLDLIFLVFDYLLEKMPEDYEKEYETVLSFSKEQQAFYVIFILDGEVNNGGFNQYYYNSSGQFASITPDAFELIGAPKHAELMRRANTIYERENQNITDKQDGTMKGFMDSYENNPLDEFDEEYYSLAESINLDKLLAEFVRKNKTAFINS